MCCSDAYQSRTPATRYLAVEIARDCNVQDLGDVLTEIALSDAETHELRAAAAYAVADIGSEEYKGRLAPLLGASREIDPNDQLRGAALQAIHSGDKYDDALWSYLKPPRQSTCLARTIFSSRTLFCRK